MDTKSLAQASDEEIREYLNRAHRRGKRWQVSLWGMLLLVIGAAGLFGYMANASMILKMTERGQHSNISICLLAVVCGVCGGLVNVCGYFLSQRADRCRNRSVFGRTWYELIGIEPIGRTGSLLFNDGGLPTLEYRIKAKDDAGNACTGVARIYQPWSGMGEVDLRWRDAA